MWLAGNIFLRGDISSRALASSGHLCLFMKYLVLVLAYRSLTCISSGCCKTDLKIQLGSARRNVLEQKLNAGVGAGMLVALFVKLRARQY